MPEDLLTVADQLFSAAASIQGTSLSRSKQTLSNYLRLLFPKIVNFVHIVCAFKPSRVFAFVCFVVVCFVLESFYLTFSFIQSNKYNNY